MKRINENTLARIVTLREGGKKSQSVAQVKESIRILGKELARFKASAVMEWVERHERT